MTDVNAAGDDNLASPSDARVAVQNFTHSVECRMKPALDAAVSRRDRVVRQLSDLDETDKALTIVKTAAAAVAAAPPSHHVVTGHPPPPFLQTRVNIGEEFYVRADVFAPEPLIVDIGLGYLVEMSVEETTHFLKQKRSYLQRVADEQSEQIVEIQTHLQKAASLLSQLNSHTV